MYLRSGPHMEVGLRGHMEVYILLLCNLNYITKYPVKLKIKQIIYNSDFTSM